MGLLDLSVNFFVTLFALIDPIGNIPIFAAATAGATEAGRRRVAVYIALFISAFMAFFYLTGLGILEFFGISLPAFRIAGGILLFLLGLDMTRSDFLTTFADPGSVHDTTDVRGYARRSFERLIVPFAMPLLIGPGAISAVIIQAGAAAKFGPVGFAAGLGAIAAVGVATVAAFWATTRISKVLGQIGMAIVVRVLGLILCALAIQFIIAGLGEATTGLISKGVLQPYGH